MIELKSSLRDPATSLDAQLLLKRLRGRHDLFAKIAEDIDQVLTPSRPSRRLIATPQAARPKLVLNPLLAAVQSGKPKPLLNPLSDTTEQEKIARLRIWVQWLLWATPLTAFFSAHHFKQKWLAALSLWYLLFGILLNLGLARDLDYGAMFTVYFLPPAVMIIEALSRKPTILFAMLIAFLLCLPVYIVFSSYVLPYHFDMTAFSFLPPLIISHFISGGSLTHFMVKSSRRVLGLSSAELRRHGSSSIYNLYRTWASQDCPSALDLLMLTYQPLFEMFMWSISLDVRAMSECRETFSSIRAPVIIISKPLTAPLCSGLKCVVDGEVCFDGQRSLTAHK